MNSASGTQPAMPSLPLRLALRVLTLAALATGPLLAPPVRAAAESSPRNILLIWEATPEQYYVRQINEGIRKGLEAADAPPTLFIEYLDTLRFGSRPGHREQFLAWLHDKYAAQQIDLLAVTAQDTLQLVTDRPAGMWPGIPVAFGTLGELTIDIRREHPEVSGLVLENWLPGYIDTIRTLLPGTRRIALIQGGSDIERQRADWWTGLFRAQGLEVIPLVGLSEGQLLAQVAQLPPDAVAFYFGVGTDAQGRGFDFPGIARRVSAAASRPMFSLDDLTVDIGVVGGPTPDWREAGYQFARHLLARLDGAEPVIEVLPAAQYTSLNFDGRELARWGIPESRAPAGSNILFPQRNLWRDHRNTMLAVLAIGIVQSLLIVAILVQRRKRARAQADLGASFGRLRALTSQLITAQEEERTRIARDLHDDIGQRVASMSIALSRMTRAAPDEASREELGALREQASALSSELRHLSHDMHPGMLEHLGLVEALRARCDEFASEGPTRASLEVSTDWRNVPKAQETCLYRVVQEALRNVRQHAAATQVRIALRRSGARAVLEITDDGRGFEYNRASPRTGLGLVSLGERVRMLGGEMEIRSAPGQGSTLVVTLPDGEADAA